MVRFQFRCGKLYSYSCLWPVKELFGNSFISVVEDYAVPFPDSDIVRLAGYVSGKSTVVIAPGSHHDSKELFIHNNSPFKVQVF